MLDDRWPQVEHGALRRATDPERHPVERRLDVLHLAVGRRMRFVEHEPKGVDEPARALLGVAVVDDGIDGGRHGDPPLLGGCTSAPTRTSLGYAVFRRAPPAAAKTERRRLSLSYRPDGRLQVSGWNVEIERCG